MKAVAFTAEVEAWAKGHWRAMFQLCSRFRQRSNKLEFNSSMMMKRADLAFGWQRRRESDDVWSGPYLESVCAE